MVRWWLLQVVGAACFGAAWVQGWVHSIYADDATRLTIVISVLLLIGLAVCHRGGERIVLLIQPSAVDPHEKRWRWVSGLSGALVGLGLLGTLIGIGITTGAQEGQIDVRLRDLGIGTAIQTTIAGIVASMWLELSGAVARRD